MKSSLTRFIATYADLISLVFKNDKLLLVSTGTCYLMSFSLIGFVFLVLLALLKSMIVTGNLSMDIMVEFSLMDFQLSISRFYCLSTLLALYLLSSIVMYFAERQWHRSIHQILSGLYKAKANVGNKKINKENRQGAIATMRVSNILLSIMSPFLISLVAFLALCWVDWRMAVIGLVVVVISLIFFLDLGRKTKKASLEMAGDDDDIETETPVLKKNENSLVDERLDFLSGLFQLKARSKLVSNLMFTFLIILVVSYFNFAVGDPQKFYRLIAASLLVYLLYGAVRTIGAKAVPLSRQYNSVRKFLNN
ncbi:MAG: hypothetical protein ACJATK_001399 [Paracoccaceae bacterium]|jgi:hypothetical protein